MLEMAKHWHIKLGLIVGNYSVVKPISFHSIWHLLEMLHGSLFVASVTCDKVLKNGPSKILGEQPVKYFTWSILEYFVPYKYFITTFTLTYSQTILKYHN